MKFLSESLSPFVKVLLSVAVLMCCFPISVIVMSAAMLALPQWAASTEGMVVLQAVGTICIFGLAFSLCKNLFLTGEKGLFNVKNIKIGLWVWALILPIAAAPCIEWLMEWNNTWKLPAQEMWRELQKTNEDLTLRLLSSETVIGLAGRTFAMAIVPAVCEELFFRGVFQKLCTRWLGSAIWGIVFSSVIFSFVHFEIFAFIPRFVLSCFLGLLFAATGSIWLNVLCHFMNNFLVCMAHSALLTTGNETIWSQNNLSEWPLVVLSAATVLFFFIKEGKGLVKKEERELRG